MKSASLAIAMPGPRPGEARWTRAQSLKNGMIATAARAAIAALAWMPVPWLRALGRAVGVFAYAVFADARRTAHANLARVFPRSPERERRALARAAYRALGGWLGETVALLGGRERVPPLPLDAESAKVLDAARADGRGVVFASAHLGPWERVAAGLVRAGVPLVTIARESYDPRFTALYDRLRGGGGVRSIYRGSPGAATRIVRALRHGEVLGVPMDLRSRVASIEAPFLGWPASTPVGPARIALRTGAAVVVGTAARDTSGALIIRVTRVRTDDLRPGPAGERALVTRLNEELSRRVLALPEGWPWMHDRFDTGGVDVVKA